MNRALSVVAILSAFAIAPCGTAQGVADPAEVKTIQDLVAKIQARERAVQSVQIEMRTRGSFPGEGRFETVGTLRVLKTTHFHSSMTMNFGDGITSEFETVKTPAGVMMRELDPAQGEKFVRMDKALLDELEAASRAVGGEGAPVGPGSDLANGPLGSAMLADMNEQFELSVSGPKRIGDSECWTVGGARRAKPPGDDEMFGLADRVEILVRRADCAVIRMTQLDDGVAVVDVEITSLQIDRPIDEASFAIEVPSKARVIDVRDHPPARAQIERIFAEAEAKGWKRGDAVPASKPSEGPESGR